MSEPLPPPPSPGAPGPPQGPAPMSPGEEALRMFKFLAEKPPGNANPATWQPLSPEALQALLPGYEVGRLLGRGGMGAVYQGVQKQLDRPVAIKILPPGLDEEDPTFGERFRNEARIMARMDHPNIVSVFDFGETTDGQLYFVMELMDGTDVARMIATQKRLKPEEVRAIAVAVCDALEAAHELGVVHRDVKPANVLINKKGQVKVADFGLARTLDLASTRLTCTGHAVGTPEFIAPEVFSPGVELNGRADLYALGVMLYQMLTGEMPRGAYKPASLLVPGMDALFDVVIGKAMQVKREDRYASAREMRQDLERILVRSGGRDGSGVPVAAPVRPQAASAPVTESVVPVPAARMTSARERTPDRAVRRSPGGKARLSLQRAERRTRIAVSLLSVILCAAAGFLALNRLGEGLVTLSYDLPFLVHRAGGANEVRAVYLDQLKGDLLDRSLQAPLLDRLREGGARAVVYDIIFDQDWPDPAVDEAFAEAIRRFRGVTADGSPVPGARRGVLLLACGRELLGQAGAAGERLILPNDRLLEAADGEFGLVTLLHDANFTVRELTAGTRDEPSMTWKAAVALGADLDEATRLTPRWINFLGPPPRSDQPERVAAIPSLTARSVLDGVDASFFRDKIVVVGGKPGIVSPKLGEDLFATPFHRLDHRGRLPLMSGVEVQATILANLLQRNWLERSGSRADLLLIWSTALVAGLGLIGLRPFAGLLATLLGILGLAVAGVWSVHFSGVWFPWTVAAFVQLPVALVGGTAAHFYMERHFRLRLTEEQKQLRAAFEKYLSPKMLERLTAEGFQLDPGGDLAHAAMMFTDIEAFTDMCQRVKDPLRIVENLNGYLERTTNHIFDHDGVVIKFIGDAIFAAWGVPFDDEQAPVKAVRAAWKLYESAKFLVDGDELRTRVGLHFGEVVAGNVGSTKRIDYTLIGDAVNLTARLEGMNKMLGTNILLSEAIQAHAAGEFLTRRVGQFRVKGRQEGTMVYELLGPGSDEELPPWVRLYHEALAAFETGDVFEARALFSRADQARLNGDGPSRFFLDWLAKGPTSAAGVIELTEK